MPDRFGRLAGKRDRVASATLQLTRWSADEANHTPPPVGLIRTVRLAAGSAGMSDAEIAVLLNTTSERVESIRGMEPT